MSKTKNPTSRSSYRIFTAFLILLLLTGIAIAALRHSSLMERFQESVSWSQDRALTGSSFSVSPGGYASYKFTVPSGAMDVAVRGDFYVANAPARNNARGNGVENQDVEVYLLNDAAFVVWRNGYSAGSEYESGRVTKGNMEAQLPSGPGVYYLVFSNRFSPRTAKLVNASVLLYYKSWLPESLVVIKDRALNWLGL